MDRDAIDAILETVATWPEAAQEEFLTSFEKDAVKQSGIYRLSDDERAAVRRGLAEMRAGQLASEEEVAAVFDRYR